jgi:hypothetical protein
MQNLTQSRKAAKETGADRPRPWLRRIGIVLLVLMAIAIGVGGWMVYTGISISLQAEKTLHAWEFAVRLVDQFVQENGRWPASWEELQKVKSAGQWPSELRERVAIDFKADMVVVARQDPMRFDAIKPIGPYYDFREVYVPQLQETLKEAMKKRGRAHRSPLK